MSDYDFKQLSYLDFEDLSRDLMQAELDLYFESFSMGPDEGIDFRHAKARNENTIIIQSKQFARSTFSVFMKHLTDERTKLDKLKPERYILISAQDLTVKNKKRIFDLFEPYIKNTRDIYGRKDLNNLLQRHPNVERDHQKLWLTSSNMLNNFINKETIERSKFFLEEIIRKQKLFVNSDALPLAKDILENNNVLIITGQPGLGKSTLASVLICQHLYDKYQPIFINNSISEGWKLYNEDEKQIFYFDDFLGATFLGDQTSFLQKNEDRDIISFIKKIQRSQSSKLIITSRDHILNQATAKSEQFKSDFPSHQKIVIELSSYTKIQKARMLYNHINLGDLPEEYKTALLQDNFYFKIIEHENYNPRIIEWLTTHSKVKETPPDKFQNYVIKLLQDPFEIWEIAYTEQISKSAQTLLLAIYTLDWQFNNFTRTEECFVRLNQIRSQKYNFSHNSDSFKSSIKELSGAFISFTHNKIQYLNPSIKDFMSRTIASSTNDVQDIVQSIEGYSQLLTFLKAMHLNKFSLNKYGKELASRAYQVAKKNNGSLHDNFQSSIDKINSAFKISEETECSAFINVGIKLLNDFLALRDEHTLESLLNCIQRVEQSSWKPLNSIEETESFNQLRLILVEPEEHDLDASTLVNVVDYVYNIKPQSDKLNELLLLKADRYIEEDLEAETDGVIAFSEHEELTSYYSSIEQLDILIGGDFELYLDRVMDRIIEIENDLDDQTEEYIRPISRPISTQKKDAEIRSEIIQMFSSDLMS